MTMDSIVPNCPSGLCISKQDFLKPDFSVDNFFIEQNVKDTPLDTLRDDLGVYLKVLRSSMIELINEDYADFVNLSTNLVGLDTTIRKLEEPLIKVQTEVDAASSGIETTLTSVKTKLNKQAKIREKKESLMNLQNIWETLGKVERMLARETQVDGRIPTDVAERIAGDVNHLLFAVSKMNESNMIRDIEPRVDAVCDKLNSSLDLSLIQGLQEGNTVVISQCCRIYATIDRIACAEHLVREKVIGPVLAGILTESNLENNAQGLKGVLKEAIRTIPKYLSELVRITMDERNMEEKSVKGFDFLVNAFWPEITDNIDRNLCFIFSPGNPGEFFKHYTHASHFISEFEDNLISEESVLRLRNHPCYLKLESSWNLAVYFQIRFQEIATPLELALGSGLLERAEFSRPSLFLRCSEQLLTALRKCFDDGIFLVPLGDKFFKLALQTISRYRVFGSKCVARYQENQKRDKGETAGEMEKTKMTKSITTKDFQNIQVPTPKTHRRSASDQNLPEQAQTELKENPLTLSNLVMLHSDIVLLGGLLPEVLADLTTKAFMGLNVNLTKAIECSVLDLESILPLIQDKIVTSAASEPTRLVKQVSDIPRMYRRTNRETPTKPCQYVTSLVTGLDNFRRKHSSLSSSGSLSVWLTGVVENILTQYTANVTDVLNNVTKMEESLRKLKKVRCGAGGVGGARAGAGLSDDDKIRLQLYLDVMYFAREVDGWGLTGVKNLSEIKAVVEAAANSFAPQ